MGNYKAKILVLVEGSRTDMRLMNHIFETYEIDAKYEIVSYNTNIYVLYNEMFYEGKPGDMDILQMLRACEQDESRKQIFDQDYTDIVLIFDLDPQDPQFTYDKITAMVDHFTESTDMGKLYLNYPMVEAFYHMTKIPDHDYNNRTVFLSELINHTYKSRVNTENRNRDYSKFAVTREECTIVIKQNIEKSCFIVNGVSDCALPEPSLILSKQIEMLSNHQKMHVLCTCVFFVADYDIKLLK